MIYPQIKRRLISFILGQLEQGLREEIFLDKVHSWLLEDHVEGGLAFVLTEGDRKALVARAIDEVESALNKLYGEEGGQRP